MQTTDKQVTISDHIKQPLLQQGSTGLAVAELQTLLKTRGFYPGDIDGIFSPTVKKAVISFQHSVFLVEDGMVGALTWQALYTGTPVNMPILILGSRGTMVTTLQRLLTTTNDYRGAVDGEFGSLTKLAVQAFQQRWGLVVDGIAGDRTWQALSKVPH